MLKMKSALCIVAIFSLALVSCVDRLADAEMPNDKNGAVTMVKALVKPVTLEGITGEGLYKWDGLNSIGINGTSKGVNERYLPVQSTIGGNETYFYGNEVAGDLTIYMPYSKDGGVRANDSRIVIPAVQKYYADPFDHLMYNSTLLGRTTNDVVEFDFYTGLVKVLLKYDIQDIVSVKVMIGNIDEKYDNGTPEDTLDDVPFTNYFAGEYSIDNATIDEAYNPCAAITINEFAEGTNTTIDNPMVVWASVAPGIYQNLVIEITDKNNVTISSPVKGPFEVSSLAVASKECVAKKVNYNNGVDDMLPEDGNFNE